jgi:hypothetical protein
MMGNGFGMGLGGGLVWLSWILLIIGIVWAAKVGNIAPFIG